MNESQSRSGSSFWRRDGVFLLLLVLVFLLRYLPSFLRGDLFGPFRDNVWIYGPLFSRTAEIAWHGSFPYWLDTILGGFPIFDTPHFSPTYPFYFFGFLNYGIELDAVVTLTQLTLLHLLILYLNFYVMIRNAGSSGFGAFCGATVGFINGTTVGYAHWITIIASYSWFPLLIAGAIRLLKSPDRWSVLLFSVACGLLITASPAQSVIHSVFFCAVFFTCGFLWSLKNRGFAHVLRLGGCLVLAFLLIAGLSAVATVPMTLDTSTMIRHVGEHTAVIGHQSIPWKAFIQHQLLPSQVWHVLLDSRYLGIVGGPYVGPFALLGVGLCWLGMRHLDNFSRFLIILSSALAAYGLLAGLGTYAGFTQLHFHLPLLNRIREAGRHLVFFTTFISLLSGVGFHLATTFTNKGAQLSGERTSRLIEAVLWLLCGILFVIEITMHGGLVNQSWLVLLALPASYALLRWNGPFTGAKILPILSLLLLSVAIADNGTTQRYLADYYKPENLKALRLIRRLTTLPEIQNFRVAFRDSVLSPRHWAMNGSYYGIKSFYADMTPAPYDQFQDMNRESLPNYRELMGAKYVVCNANEKPRNESDQLLLTEDTYRIYKVAQPMPQVSLIHALAGSYANASQFYSIVSRGFNYNQFAYVMKQDYRRVNDFLSNRVDRNGGSNDFLDLTNSDFNRRVVSVETTVPSLLILNERYNKAWNVTVNAHATRLFAVNLCQIAVLLNAGHSDVQFDYKPILFYRLLILQRMTILILILAASAAFISLRRENISVLAGNTSPKSAR